MKKFIFKTSLFSLPIIILAFFIDYSLKQIPNDYSHKKKYLDQHSQKIQVLIFGDSQTYYGINPVYFSKKTFNASHRSQTLNFDYEVFKKFQNNLDSLEILILSVSYFSLFGKLENGFEAWRTKNYAIYYGIHSYSIYDHSELLSNKLVDNLYRLYSYYFKNEDAITCTDLGWGSIYKSENSEDLYETGKRAALRHTEDAFSEKNVNTFTENLKILNSILAYCNQRKISLVFLTTPTYHTYRDHLNDELVQKMMKTVNDFVKEHPYCYFFNYFDHTDFVAEDFFDGNHLNEIGVEKFSVLVNERLKEISNPKNPIE